MKKDKVTGIPGTSLLLAVILSVTWTIITVSCAYVWMTIALQASGKMFM